MSKFAPYPEYASTSVGWLNEIPSHWRVKPLWSLFRRIKRTGHESERLLSVYRDYGVIPKDSRDDNHNRASEDLSAYQLVEPGDLAINKMKAWQGSVGISSHRGIVSPAYFIFKAEHKENPRYIHHLMRCNRYIAGYQSISKGIRVNQWDLDPDKHARMPVVLPPSHEQQAIVDFLDREAARIDTLIAKKTRFIELLKERRQAIIRKALTKGLDDSLEMKDSKVDWVGDIPASWKLARIKTVSVLRNTRRNELSSESIYIGLEDVESGTGCYQPTAGNSRKSDDSTVSIFKGRDVLYGKLRPYLKKVIVADQEGACSTEFLVIDLESKRLVKPEWLHGWFLTDDVTQRIESGCDGAKMPRASWEHISSIPIPFPHMEEQARILDSLSRKTAYLDVLIAKTKRSIELLKEHRAALITAAVTGKIDVREAA